MRQHKTITKKSLLYLAKKRLSGKGKGKVPTELQQAINDCQTMKDLLELLFSTDFVKDEAIIKAFDKRIDVIERSM